LGPAELWRTPLDPGLSSLAIAGDRVFTQVRQRAGGEPMEFCVALDAATGVEIWSRDLRTEYGGAIIQWQNAVSPIVLENLVIVNSNGRDQCLMAFHVADGTVAWRKIGQMGSYRSSQLWDDSGSFGMW
jgi:outer membrane protein assembly factor BamB